ncbi:hypothetical protein [Amycolatopsis sp. cmx-4-61]|uniref:hypothetical protein n=1 Tax=Amycolatopsis sp. cmx-4-61 TaxID=2790937 RepID=UPI00397D78C8
MGRHPARRHEHRPRGALLSNSYLDQDGFAPYKVYLVGRSRRWIPTPEIFNQYAFDASKIQHPANMPGPGPDIPGR